MTAFIKYFKFPRERNNYLFETFGHLIGQAGNRFLCKLCYCGGELSNSCLHIGHHRHNLGYLKRIHVSCKDDPWVKKLEILKGWLISDEIVHLGLFKEDRYKFLDSSRNSILQKFQLLIHGISFTNICGEGVTLN